MGERAERFAKVVQQTVGQLLLRDIKDPRITGGDGLLTVTRVMITDDLSSARVYVTLLGASEEREKELLVGLAAARPFLQRALGHALRAKKVPLLRFFLDQSLAHVDRVEKILHELHTERLAQASERSETVGTPVAADIDSDE